MMAFTVFLIFSYVSPAAYQWFQGGSSPRKVWIDWRKSDFSDENYRIHLLGGRLRSRSFILNSSSYFAPPLAVRAVKRYAEKIDFVPVLKAMIDDNSTYRIHDFDYGDARVPLEIVKIPEVHKKGFVGTGVRISLLDVGVDSSHPAVRHIFRRNGVVATHDFNSGDHLKLYHSSEIMDIPFVQHGLIRYINSFSVTSDSEKLIIVYSQTPADSLANSYLYGKWSLGMTVGHLDGGTITGWDTMTVGNYGILKNFPSVATRHDSIFLTWQELDSTFQIKFAVIDSHGNFLTAPVALSTNEGFNPLIVLSDSLIAVFWIDSLRGIRLRLSENGGRSFTPERPVAGRQGSPGGISGIYLRGTFHIAAALGDTTYYAALDKNGTVLHTLSFQGTMPSIAQVNGDSVRLSIYWNGEITLFTIFNGVVLGYAVLDSSFPYGIYDSGNEVYISDERLITGNGTVVDSEFVDFVAGSGDFVIFRKRGDSDISPDPEDPTKHGTKMLSIIGGFLEGSIVGGAPGADYLIAKTERVIAGPGGISFENVIEEDFWVEAMEWSIRHGARILSSSLGYRYSHGTDWYGDSLMNGQFAHSSRLASRAVDYNLVVVTAMGNVSHTTLPDPLVGDTSLIAPADAFNILSIGGISSADSVELNCGFGPTADGRIKPDVVAPYRISWPDTDGTVYLIGGTSISTAIVAGGLGAVLEAHPSWNAEKIIRYVRESADQIPSLPDSNNVSGYGIFNALSLLNKEAYEKTPPGDRDRILTVYPNPVRGERKLHIKFLSFHTGRTVIRIYSIDGSLISKQSVGCSGIGLNEFTLNLPESISPGTYFILLKTGFSSAKSQFSVVK